MLSIVDKYIIDNFHVKSLRQIAIELGVDWMLVRRRSQKYLYNGIIDRKFELNWDDYLQQLTVMASEYRTTHRGMWAKSLLEDIFKEDYEDVS